MSQPNLNNPVIGNGPPGMSMFPQPNGNYTIDPSANDQRNIY